MILRFLILAFLFYLSPSSFIIIFLSSALFRIFHLYKYIVETRYFLLFFLLKITCKMGSANSNIQKGF